MLNFASVNRKGTTKPLTEEQTKEIFKKHDVNGDGVLNKEEIITAFKELGSWVLWFRAARGLRCADGNKDGVIDENELADLVNYAFKLGYKVK